VVQVAFAAKSSRNSQYFDGITKICYKKCFIMYNATKAC